VQKEITHVEKNMSGVEKRRRSFLLPVSVSIQQVVLLAHVTLPNAKGSRDT